MQLTVENINQPQNIPSKLELWIAADLQISPIRARQLVSIYLMNDVGDLLHGDIPDELVARDKDVFWRVPVILSGGRAGRIGVVGKIDVHTETGKLQLTDSLIAEIMANAHRLVARATPEPIR